MNAYNPAKQHTVNIEENATVVSGIEVPRKERSHGAGGQEENGESGDRADPRGRSQTHRIR